MYISAGMILSPGAKDALRNKGVSIVYGEKPVEIANQVNEEKEGIEYPDDKGQLVAQIINILRKDYGVVEEDCIREISLNVMKKLTK